MSRELTRDEQRRVTDLSEFCISRLRPSREKCHALALMRLGEEGERPRELDRLLIDSGWSSEQAIGELNTFAREAFNAVTEDARSYSEIQHYSIIAFDQDGRPLSTKQLDITPEVPEGKSLLEPATDRGERRQLMRHSEEVLRWGERIARDASDRFVAENTRLSNASIAREAQLISLTDTFCKNMIEFAKTQAEQAKQNLEIMRAMKREERIDKVMVLGAKALTQHLNLEDEPKKLPANGTNGATSSGPASKVNAFFSGMTTEQRMKMYEMLTPEQRAKLQEMAEALEAAAQEEYAKHSATQDANANGAKVTS